MKIAYLVHLNMSPDSGVFKKVVAQVEQWNRRGEDGELYVLTREKEVEAGLRGRAVCVRYAKKQVTDRLKKMSLIVSNIIARKPDIVYLRQDLYYPAYACLGKSVPLILEINSDINPELWNYSKAQWLYNKLTERRLWRACRGAVCVTNELASLKKRLSERKPCRVIANGIALNGWETRQNSVGKSAPSLIFMGHPDLPWHGTDKILTMAGHFPDWQFHLVGPGKLNNTKQFPNVKCHGRLGLDQYGALLMASDIAISTMALHRKNMNEACPLKTREYLSYGLPIITAYRDTDFPEDPDFILRLPNVEKNIEGEIDRIREFVYRWKGRKVPLASIRHIDLAEKERERIEFFHSVLEGHST